MVLASAFSWAEVRIEPPEDWEVGSGYQYNMTYYAQVLRADGTYIDHAESILAAFDALGVCRGAINPIEGPNGRLFQLGIAGDSVEELGLVLKVLDAVTGETYLVQETVDFISDAVVPEDGLSNPLQLHVVGEDVSLQLEAGWNLVALTRPVTAESLGRLLAEVPMRVESNAYVRCASVEDFQVGVGYWIFSETERRIELIPDMTQSSWNGPELVKGWNLVGASSDTPEWLPLAKYMFKWDGRGYEPTAKPALGVWVYRE
jgi:hypothetical protein